MMIDNRFKRNNIRLVCGGTIQIVATDLSMDALRAQRGRSTGERDDGRRPGKRSAASERTATHEKEGWRAGGWADGRMGGWAI
jgi:hypothetical protein